MILPESLRSKFLLWNIAIPDSIFTMLTSTVGKAIQTANAMQSTIASVEKLLNDLPKQNQPPIEEPSTPYENQGWVSHYNEEKKKEVKEEPDIEGLLSTLRDQHAQTSETTTTLPSSVETMRSNAPWGSVFEEVKGNVKTQEDVYQILGMLEDVKKDPKASRTGIQLQPATAQPVVFEIPSSFPLRLTAATSWDLIVNATPGTVVLPESQFAETTASPGSYSFPSSSPAVVLSSVGPFVVTLLFSASDGVGNSGSMLFSSATANFSGMIGHTLVLGAPYSSTHRIMSIKSPTEVYLESALGSSATGVSFEVYPDNRVRVRRGTVDTEVALTVGGSVPVSTWVTDLSAVPSVTVTNDSNKVKIEDSVSGTSSSLSIQGSLASFFSPNSAQGTNTTPSLVVETRNGQETFATPTGVQTAGSLATLWNASALNVEFLDVSGSLKIRTKERGRFAWLRILSGATLFQGTFIGSDLTWEDFRTLLLGTFADLQVTLLDDIKERGTTEVDGDGFSTLEGTGLGDWVLLNGVGYVSNPSEDGAEIVGWTGTFSGEYTRTRQVVRIQSAHTVELPLSDGLIPLSFHVQGTAFPHKMEPQCFVWERVGSEDLTLHVTSRDQMEVNGSIANVVRVEESNVTLDRPIPDQGVQTPVFTSRGALEYKKLQETMPTSIESLDEEVIRRGVRLNTAVYRGEALQHLAQIKASVTDLTNVLATFSPPPIPGLQDFLRQVKDAYADVSSLMKNVQDTGNSIRALVQSLIQWIPTIQSWGNELERSLR